MTILNDVDRGILELALENGAAENREVLHAAVGVIVRAHRMEVIDRTRAELEPSIDRVRRLHSQSEDSILAPGRWCPACGQETPCPTIRALRGDQ